MRHSILARLGLLVALLAGCSSAETPSRCTPGASVACTCPGGGSGGQICGADGQSYGTCICADAAAPADAPASDAPAVDRLDADAIVPDAPAADAVDVASQDVPSVDAVPDAPADVPGHCEGGRRNCDGNVENGCEVDTSTDPMNCGGCRTACPPAPGMVATCTAGVCGTGPLTCAAPRANCDGDVANGCETDTNIGAAMGPNIANCGACGTTCSFANAAAACAAGRCTMAECVARFADCDSDPSDGCEANLDSNTTNCGRCARRCEYPNASSVCANGSCAMGACDRGWCDRNRSTADGCEYRGACS